MDCITFKILSFDGKMIHVYQRSLPLLYVRLGTHFDPKSKFRQFDNFQTNLEIQESPTNCWCLGVQIRKFLLYCYHLLTLTQI